MFFFLFFFFPNSMLRQSIPPLQPFDGFTPTESNNNDNNSNVNRAVLLELIQENHLLYHMEARDRPNNMIRLLVELHRLGGMLYSTL